MSQLILQPDATLGVDTYVSSVGATINFDAEIVLRAGTDKFSKSSIAYVRPLLRFDLSGVPAGSVIHSATLTLYPANGILSGGGTFNLYRLTQPAWTESGATWNTYDGAQAWNTAGGDYTTLDGDETSLAGPGENLVFAALKNLAIDALANRGGLLHAIILGPEIGSTDRYYEAYGSDWENEAARPRLIVNYTPIPVLAIVDHGDDTGATATIALSETEAINTVYVQRFSGETTVPAWQSAGTRSGNGDVQLDLPAGHYFAYVASSSDAITMVSTVAYFVVTDGVEALHARCLDAVQARIRALALSGLQHDRVIVQKFPLERNVTGESGVGLPAIVVSPRRAAMPPTVGTNHFDDVHYDVQVSIFDRDNQEPTLEANLDRQLLWREQIARAFRNQRLVGVPQIINAEVDPTDELSKDGWKHQLMISTLLVRFTSRETRGFN
jgi:hypothetical protein